jgi:hypothetical protein
MRFFSVWIVGNHTFISIFPFLELHKQLIDGRRPNTCKKISFGGVEGPLNDKDIDF